MKKMYRMGVLLALLQWLGAGPVAAQFLWQRLVHTPALRETGKFLTPVAGGFVMVGETVNASVDLLYLSKVNYAGDTVWTRRIRFPAGNGVYARGVIEDRTGNLVVSATVFNSSGTTTRSWGGLAKLTPTGDTLWTRRTDDGLNTLVLGNDGNYVLAGGIRTSNITSIPTLYKYSPAGALLWSQRVPFSSTVQGFLFNAVAVRNGYLLHLLPDLYGPSKFIAVDEQGQYRQAQMGSPRASGQLRLDSDGNVLVAGGNLTKLSPVGDTLWSHAYRVGNSPYQGLSHVVELPNGTYLASGSWYNGFDRDLTLFLISHSGVLLRDTLIYRGGSNETAVGVSLTPNLNYVAGLSVDTYVYGNPTPTYAQLWVCLRSWARLLPTRPGQPTPQNRVFAYPNPTANDLTLATADEHALVGRWVLLDLLGRDVQSGTLAGLGPARLSLAGQPAGCYLLRVHDERRHTEQTLRIEKQ